MLRAQFAQAHRADLLGHLEQDFAIEAERAAFREHRRQRADIDAVLALVVGGAASVDALALDHDLPRRQSRPPEIVETANGVAVAVDQRGDEVRIFHALGHQDRRPERIVEHAAGEAEPRQRRHDLVDQIRTQRAGALRLLTRTRDGDAARQVGEKAAVVEIGVGAGDGVGRGSWQNHGDLEGTAGIFLGNG